MARKILPMNGVVIKGYVAPNSALWRRVLLSVGRTLIKWAQPKPFYWLGGKAVGKSVDPVRPE